MMIGENGSARQNLSTVLADFLDNSAAMIYNEDEWGNSHEKYRLWSDCGCSYGYGSSHGSSHGSSYGSSHDSYVNSLDRF